MDTGKCGGPPSCLAPWRPWHHVRRNCRHRADCCTHCYAVTAPGAACRRERKGWVEGGDVRGGFLAQPPSQSTTEAPTSSTPCGGSWHSSRGS